MRRRSCVSRAPDRLAVGDRRAEEGCISYRFFEDTEADNDFVFVEEWVDRAALEQHFGTAHVAELMRAVRGVIVGQPDVKFHEVASTIDLAQVTSGAA